MSPTSRADRVFGSGNQAYETKNMDLLKEIEFWTVLCPTHELFMQSCTGSSAHGMSWYEPLSDTSFAPGLPL
jgi:hypothetical protein